MARKSKKKIRKTKAKKEERKTTKKRQAKPAKSKALHTKSKRRVVPEKRRRVVPTRNGTARRLSAKKRRSLAAQRGWEKRRAAEREQAISEIRRKAKRRLADRRRRKEKEKESKYRGVPRSRQPKRESLKYTDGPNRTRVAVFRKPLSSSESENDWETLAAEYEEWAAECFAVQKDGAAYRGGYMYQVAKKSDPKTGEPIWLDDGAWFTWSCGWKDGGTDAIATVTDRIMDSGMGETLADTQEGTGAYRLRITAFLFWIASGSGGFPDGEGRD